MDEMRDIGRVFWVRPDVNHDLMRQVVKDDATQTLRQKGIDWEWTLIHNPEPLDPFMAIQQGVPEGSVSWGWRAEQPRGGSE